MKLRYMLKNEDGALLILVLIMLVLFTLIGISASRTATIEVMIAGNDLLHKIAFSEAENGIEI